MKIPLKVITIFKNIVQKLNIYNSTIPNFDCEEEYQTLRILQVTCSTGEFDDSGTCTPCSYSCAECEFAANQCTSCAADRTKDGTTCPCNAQTYDDGSSTACQSCAPSCYTCSAGGPSACTSCYQNNGQDVFLTASNRVVDSVTYNYRIL